MALLIFFCLGAFGASLWWTTNRLAALDSRCERAMADIDVQLKQRHEMLPNLLSTVRAFAAHERDALDMVTRARAGAMSAARGDAQLRAEATLTTQLSQLMTIVESYPELQASQHFQALRMEIAGAENKIAASRRYLNATVDEYNATLRQFPANVLSKLLPRHHPRSFYDIGVERVLLDEAPSLKF